ncbi:unnamed protein product, partial [Staurois parvus]
YWGGFWGTDNRSISPQIHTRHRNTVKVSGRQYGTTGGWWSTGFSRTGSGGFVRLRVPEENWAQSFGQHGVSPLTRCGQLQAAKG